MSIAQIIRNTPNYVLWLTLRCCAIECSRQEVSDRRYQHPQEAARGLNEKIISEELLQLAKMLYDETETRRRTVDDKVKTLLTLNGILVPISAGILFNVSSLIVTVTALCLLLVSMYLLLQYSGLNVCSIPDIGAVTQTVSESSQDKATAAQLAMAHMFTECADFNHRNIDFLADVFRAARRTFFVALICVVFGMLGIRVIRPSDEKVISRLRSEPRMIELLRGPKGDKGESGLQGPKGEKGETGAKGGRGDKGIQGDRGKKGDRGESSATPKSPSPAAP